MKKSRLLYGIIGVVIFSSGWIVGLLVKDWAWFEYDNSFNLFDLFYTVVSVGLAVYIARAIEKGVQDRRNQKDIIIGRIDAVDSQLEQLLSCFVLNNKKYSIDNTVILGRAKRIGMDAKKYERFIQKYYPEFANSKEYKDTIINTRKLVKLCTELPKKPSPNISCVNDVWSYSSERFWEIQQELSRLRELCFNLSLLLNGQ
ncbi:MAG: hypothetical protein MJY88_03460 [Bacteroidales bacterium]|nr:hypothetical protein [Bacteroidales bacterium]